MISLLRAVIPAGAKRRAGIHGHAPELWVPALRCAPAGTTGVRVGSGQ
jgi:hypothetical protein